MAEQQETLLEFPCQFPLKIMGKHEEQFVLEVLTIVVRHAPDFDHSTIDKRPSRNGNYISITCTINAVSKEQLDALYREISSHPLVKFAL